MTQPTPTHRWTWDGSRTLPDWLDGFYHWHDDQLVIHTPDRYVHPEPGWLVIHWTDDTITVASPQVADRVYGPDGLAGRLARAEAATDGELRRQLDAAIAALGRSETELAQLRTAPDARPADDTTPAEPAAWTPPPPGDTREQLPDAMLALISDRLPDYLSTACQTADTLACAACYPGSGVPRPQYDEIREHAERLHERCRINQKFTGQLCACGCH